MIVMMSRPVFSSLAVLLLLQAARCQDMAALVIGGHYDGASGGSSSNVIEVKRARILRLSSEY